MVFWDSSESAEPGRLPPIVDSVQSTRNGSGTRLRQRSRVPEAWRGPPHNKLYGAGPVDSHLVKFNLAVANLAVAIAKRGVEVANTRVILLGLTCGLPYS